MVFATNNEHKLREIRQILGSQIEIQSLSDIGCTEDIPEDSDTLEGNALQKARYVAEKYGVDCFADDTGLEVDALGGAPGVHSARYATDGHDFAANRAKLFRELEGKSDRTARFRTVIALIEGGVEHCFEGIVEGTITTEERGEGGFGYDPMFQPEGYTQTFSELSPEEKNAISHRGTALRKMCKRISEI